MQRKGTPRINKGPKTKIKKYITVPRQVIQLLDDADKLVALGPGQPPQDVGELLLLDPEALPDDAIELVLLNENSRDGSTASHKKENSCLHADQCTCHSMVLARDEFICKCSTLSSVSSAPWAGRTGSIFRRKYCLHTSMQEDWASAPASRSRDGLGRGRRNNTHHSNSRGPTATSNSPKPALTHFLSIPLGHLLAVRSAAETFSSTLLVHSPGIKGPDPTIVVPPRRLHLTLGVMTLDDDERLTGENGNAKNVSSALELLRSLRSRVLATLEGYPLHVPLTAIDIMKPERNDPSRAHVLFAGPSVQDLASEDGQRIRRVCELLNTEFVKSGFIVDDKRPLKLHCTLVNTSHRKPRPKGGYAKRTPFSFTEILNSGALPVQAPTGDHVSYKYESQQLTVGSSPSTQILSVVEESKAIIENSVQPFVTKRDGEKVNEYAVAVDLGTHAVSEIQICEMGSWGSEGEYVCVGKIDL